MIELGFNFVSILSDSRIMSIGVKTILDEIRETKKEKVGSIY